MTCLLINYINANLDTQVTPSAGYQTREQQRVCRMEELELEIRWRSAAKRCTLHNFWTRSSRKLYKSIKHGCKTSFTSHKHCTIFGGSWLQGWPTMLDSAQLKPFILVQNNPPPPGKGKKDWKNLPSSIVPILTIYVFILKSNKKVFSFLTILNLSTEIFFLLFTFMRSKGIYNLLITRL